ncbi:esterase/lipase family protein [Paludisphaera rhizosphaerae]|uniref:esterase/lipase family protein n=1 Tax=Paludisphaera rhizosphaerae TaxID=2711216 RepID=UPI0013ED7F61|nr:hypothetical protein [Paludisphaera rhizosphaerae]
MPGIPGACSLISGSPIGRGIFALALAFVCGCRTMDVGPVVTTKMTAPAATAESRFDCACRERREGARLERRGIDAAVDRYYEATLQAASLLSSELSATGGDSESVVRTRGLYNGCLADCLRAGQKFGRLDPRSTLLVNTSQGTRSIPVRHVGFVWKPDDFVRLVDADSVPANPNARACHHSPGLGASVSFQRPNPRREAQDDYLPRIATFNATAVLRPETGSPDGAVLELYDPLRVKTVAFGSSPAVPLGADYGLAAGLAYEIQESRGPYALAGFAMPERMLSQADLRMLEPYQPGKKPFVLVHGLLADPFIFTDMIVALEKTPRFLDEYQIWVFRYPTGVTFVRTAAILRKSIEDLPRTVDPAGSDRALSDWTILGYSMGGLLTRLQTCWSDDALWNSMATRPLDSLSMSDEARRTARDLFYFEPSPRIRRVIYLATPHDGASPAIASASWLTTRIVQRPADTRRLIQEVEAANPGALRPGLRDLPSSVDALAAYSPLLPVVRRLRSDPNVTFHTIAGTGFHPADDGHGDGVVPLTSAHFDEAATEHHVRAFHNTIYYNSDTIDEVRRILGLTSPAFASGP